MNQNQNKSTRRKFLKNSSLTAAGAALGWHTLNPFAVPSALGANDKIRLGCIGVGNRGSQLLRGFLAQSDVDIVALCDVYEPYLARDRSQVDKTVRETLGGRVPKMGESFSGKVARYKDFRRLLDRKDIDAVMIATPDHWHAVQSILACSAGKDVYVEKPLSITIHEGRKMVQAAEKYNRVVQVGLHRRSSEMYKQLAQEVQTDKIGKVTVARAYRISNMAPAGIGRFPVSTPPVGLDWDMWLGPRPMRPHKNNLPLYKFRWWQSYSSQMANWGVHYCDSIRWVLNEQAPVSISAHGGCFAVNDDRTIPDTMEAIFELPSGVLVIFGQYEASGGTALHSGEIEFRGTLGNIYPGGRGYEIIPAGPGQFSEAKSPLKAQFIDAPKSNSDLTAAHIRNFLDCIKSRKPTRCDMETGHRSTTFAHLANIALATKSRLEWDPKKETFINNPEANNLLHYQYRQPWSLG